MLGYHTALFLRAASRLFLGVVGLPVFVLLVGYTLPRGDQIAFLSVDTKVDRWNIFLRLLDVERGVTVNLYASGGGIGRPKWSPDGSKLMFELGGEIYVIDIQNGETVNLTTHPDADTSPEWSPDGQQIVFARLDGSGHQGIYLMNNDGSHLRMLTIHQVDYNPVWTIDGEYILFQSDRDFMGGSLYTMDTNGGRMRRLSAFQVGGSVLAWSPDRTQVAFDPYSNAAPDILVTLIDGSSFYNLTRSGDSNSQPMWSPDGTQIAFSSFRDGRSQIHVVKSDGGTLRNLSPHSTYDDAPAWSPDGTLLAFSRANQNSTRSIYLMNVDSGETSPLTFRRSQDLLPAWRPYG
jgi:Tol biopolymer transport system component